MQHVLLQCLSTQEQEGSGKDVWVKKQEVILD